MKGQTPLFSHESDDWETPDEVYLPLNEEVGGFGLDAAATTKNTKCARYLDQDQNALLEEQNWHEISKGNPVWCNPAYSLIDEFTKKAKTEALKGATIYYLIPIRSDTPWFQQYILGLDKKGKPTPIGGAHEIRYIPGRVRFVKGAPKPMNRYDYSEKRKTYQYSAPFPSIIVVFRPGIPKRLETVPFIHERNQYGRKNR